MNTLLRSECLECLTNKQLHALPADAAEDEKLIFLQKMFELLSKAPKETCAPVIVRDLNKLYQEMFGETKNYAEEKSHYNQLMLQKEQAIREKIHNAEDPLLKALRFSLVGNYIDFSAVENVEEAYLEKLLEEIESPEKNGISKESFEKLKQDLREKQQLLFLTDNAGEGVLDKLLLEVIREMYPQLNIRVLVRGKPVLNDVTMEDALEIGLQNVAEVYDNGNGIAGTWLPELSLQAKTIWEEADVIIAKGQANYETLRLCEKNIYFLFLCKCEMFCRNFQVPRFTGVLVHR